MFRRGRGLARILHGAFETSLVLKGLFAAAEALLGVALFFVANDRLRAAIRWATAHELTEDPADRVAAWALAGAQALSIRTQDFYAVYLASHGALKLALVLLLVRGYRWAYPLAVAVLSGFVLYQVHRYLLQPGLGLVLLTLLDLAVIVLTLIEYRRVTAATGGLKSPPENALRAARPRDTGPRP